MATITAILPLLKLAASQAGIGIRLDPYMGFNYFVEIDGLIHGGFSEARGLESNVEVKEYAEGGRNGYVHKIPGETRYSNLVLSNGVSDIEEVYGWYVDVTNGIFERRSITVLLLDNMNLPAMWWDIKDALPVRWSGPMLNAGQDQVAVESVELVHRGIEKPSLSQVLSAARLAANLTGVTPANMARLVT